MNSDDSWTMIGKGGRHVSFPPEAAAAFGRRSAPCGAHGAHGARGPREFPEDAAAAFGRRSAPRDTPRGPRQDSDGSSSFPTDAVAAFGGSTHNRRSRPDSDGSSSFPTDAAAAFGGKQRARNDGSTPFDAAAASAFGGGDGGRRGGGDFDAAANAAFGGRSGRYRRGDNEGINMSALARKRAEASAAPPPPPPTYEEMFPALGPATTAGPTAPAATPVAAAPQKRTFADIMRTRAAEEERMAAKKAAADAEAELRERYEARERARLRQIYAARSAHLLITRDCEDEDIEETVEAYKPGDLDYDAYGVRRKELELPEPAEASTDTSSEESDHDSC